MRKLVLIGEGTVKFNNEGNYYLKSEMIRQLTFEGGAKPDQLIDYRLWSKYK